MTNTTELKSIDDLIEKLLKSLPFGEKLSTYEIAKRLKISWSTANVHCYKLKSEKKIEGKEEKKEIGEGKKMLWWC